MREDIKKLEDIINQTDSLVAMAEAGEWDKLLDLELIRTNLIADFFEKPPQLEERYLAKAIQYILDKNKILKQFSHSQRDSIRMEILRQIMLIRQLIAT